jgi:hypothetical protein
VRRKAISGPDRKYRKKGMKAEKRKIKMMLRKGKKEKLITQFLKV